MIRRILEELRPENGAPGRGLNPLGQGNRGPGPGAQNGRKVGTIHSQLGGQGGDGLGEGVMMLGHDDRIVVCDTTKSRGHQIDTLSFGRQHPEMEIWPQREKFKSLVNAYRKKHGIDRATMAECLGVKESHLHGLLYDKRVRPSLDVVQKAAEVFEVSITELIDDPGGAPPGMDPDKWAEASNRDRVLASAMLEDLMTIPEEEKDAYYKLWKQGVLIGRARMAAEEKLKKKPGSRT